MPPPCQRFSFVSAPFVLVSSKVENPSANQSRKGRKNPEPGTGVPGKETNGNQVSFRGRHSVREIHSAVMVFLIHNILPDGGHLGIPIMDVPSSQENQPVPRR